MSNINEDLLTDNERYLLRKLNEAEAARDEALEELERLASENENLEIKLENFSKN